MNITLREGEELIGILVDVGGLLQLRRIDHEALPVTTPPTSLDLVIFDLVFVHPKTGKVSIDGKELIVCLPEIWPTGADTAAQGYIDEAGKITLIKALCPVCKGDGLGDGVFGECSRCSGLGTYVKEGHSAVQE